MFSFSVKHLIFLQGRCNKPCTNVVKKLNINAEQRIPKTSIKYLRYKTIQENVNIYKAAITRAYRNAS